MVGISTRSSTSAVVVACYNIFCICISCMLLVVTAETNMHGPSAALWASDNGLSLFLFFADLFPADRSSTRLCSPIPSSCASRTQGQPGGLLRLGKLQDPPERCLLVSGRLRRRSPAAAQQRRGQGALQRASELPPPPELPPGAGSSTQCPRCAQGALLREATDEVARQFRVAPLFAPPRDVDGSPIPI